MALRDWTLVLAAAASLGLAACHRGADSGATANSNAPGRPGTGNATEVTRPQAADTPGSSGGSGIASGTSGSGGNSHSMGGPGTGLAGGMNPAPGQATGVAGGSTNSTTKSAVGNR